MQARLSTPQPYSRTEPAKGGAGRRGAGPAARGAGQGGAEGGGRRQTLLAAVPEPRPGAGGPGSPAARPAGPQRTMDFHRYRPSATPRDAAALREAAFGSLGTKKGLGMLGSKRDPGC